MIYSSLKATLTAFGPLSPSSTSKVTESLSFTTNTNFKPYVTEIGLYSENSELLVHGKLAKPIKLSDDIETTFVVRFDV